MKLGFASAILPDLSLEEVLEFAAREGFACVELMCWPVGKAERRYAGVTHKDARIDRRKLGSVGVLATPLEFHTPKLPGLGDVDWSRFFSALSDVGYSGPVCIEVEDRAYEHSLESRMDALRQSVRYLRQYMPC
jgi:sugar phosphate isomerase/epimerase